MRLLSFLSTSLLRLGDKESEDTAYCLTRWRHAGADPFGRRTQVAELIPLVEKIDARALLNILEGNFTDKRDGIFRWQNEGLLVCLSNEDAHIA